MRPERTPPVPKKPPTTGAPDAGVPSATVAPVDWWEIEPDARPEFLLLLHEFLKKLVPSYHLNESVVPPCWFHHEHLVQEILALYQYRQQSQFSPVGGPRSAIEFNGTLYLWVGRMRDFVKELGCNAREHHAQRQPLWVVDGTVQSAEYLANLELAGAPLDLDGEGEE